MNLDDLEAFKKLDPQDMLGEIENLPAQLLKAWELGQTLPLPAGKNIRQAVIAGMGGSAIAADLLVAYAAPACRVPIFVQRDYGLPGWARGPETLVIASSHSGNTEETLEAFSAALQNQCQVMVIATGGKLAELAAQSSLPLWTFVHKGQPRAAVGYSFGLLLAAFARLGLIPDPEAELNAAAQAMRTQQEELRPAVPTTGNPAKRLAGQLMGRWVNVYAAGYLAPVARRWKGQINELAKAGAGFEILPEADHNALAGLLNPAEIQAHTKTIFLQSSFGHPRNQARTLQTRHGFLVEGLDTDIYDAPGGSPLAQLWTALHFGDYMAYYLAMAYRVDPTPVEALEKFKAGMQAITH